jgi:hypothetical protein
VLGYASGMARKSNLAPLLLSPDQRRQRESLSNSRVAPAREVERTRILLQFAEGKPYSHPSCGESESGDHLPLSAQGFGDGDGSWSERPLSPAQKPVIDSAAKAWVVHLACTKPKDLRIYSDTEVPSNAQAVQRPTGWLPAGQLSGSK